MRQKHVNTKGEFPSKPVYVISPALWFMQSRLWLKQAGFSFLSSNQLKLVGWHFGEFPSKPEPRFPSLCVISPPPSWFSSMVAFLKLHNFWIVPGYLVTSRCRYKTTIVTVCCNTTVSFLRNQRSMVPSCVRHHLRPGKPGRTRIPTLEETGKSNFFPQWYHCA